jgi:hypothetical protein
MDFSNFDHLDGGLMFYALLGCLAALVIGAAWWALGHHMASPHHAGKGKAAVGAALVGALLVGGGPALVGFFTTVGARIITYNVDRSNGRIVQAQIALVVQTYCACAWQPAHVGEPIQVQYEVVNSGQRPVASVRVRADSGPVTCPREQLATGATVRCGTTHVITAADMAAGQYTASGAATGTADDGTVLSTSADGQSIRLRA